MKKWLFLFISLLLFGAVSIAQNLSQLKAGSVLTYGVNANGMEYDFIVTLRSFEKGKAPEFDWQMTAPVNKSGSVKIKLEAIKEAYAWFNYFSGSSVTLDKETSVLASEALRSNLERAKLGDKLDKPLQLNGAGSTGDDFWVKSKTDNYTCTADGKEVSLKNVVRICGSGDIKCAIIDNSATYSIILKMDIGFSISLRSVKF